MLSIQNSFKIRPQNTRSILDWKILVLALPCLSFLSLLTKLFQFTKQLLEKFYLRLLVIWFPPHVTLSLLYHNCHSLTFLFGKTLAIPVFIYFQLAGTHTKQISIVRRSINSYTNGLHVINRNESETWKGSVEKTTLYFGKRNGAILIIWHEKRKPINSDDYTALLEDDPTCLCI